MFFTSTLIRPVREIKFLQKSWFF